MAGIAALNFGQLSSTTTHSSTTHSLHRSLHPFTLFCDFDGPIVDVSDRYYNTYQLGLAAVQTTYRTRGVTIPLMILSKEQFWRMKQERTPDIEIALRSGLQGKQIDLFLQRVNQIVNQPSLLHQDQPQPGVEWALRLLHSRGIRLVLVTLRCQQQATQMLRQFGLFDLFSQIWGSQDTQAAYANQSHHKTELLAAAIEQWCPQPTQRETAWMVGDTEADILAGQAAGIPTIALTCGIRSQNYLQGFQPTCVYPNLLATAHYLVLKQSGSLPQECF